MREITHLVLHCTATSVNATVLSIMRYWKEVNKWKSPGYHYIIKRDGEIINLHPIDKPSNGVKNHNQHSIHISYIGGIDRRGKAMDTRSAEQIQAQVKILTELKEKFPEAKVCGHRDFLKPGPGWKDCPSFDVHTWLVSIGKAAWSTKFKAA